MKPARYFSIVLVEKIIVNLNLNCLYPASQIKGHNIHVRGVFISDGGFTTVAIYTAGPGCSKLTTSLVNVSLKISNLNILNLPIFFVEKM